MIFNLLGDIVPVKTSNLKEGDLLITLDSSSQFLPSYIFLPFQMK